jgi:hypothetical protein
MFSKRNLVPTFAPTLIPTVSLLVVALSTTISISAVGLLLHVDASPLVAPTAIAATEPSVIPLTPTQSATIIQSPTVQAVATTADRTPAQWDDTPASPEQTAIAVASEHLQRGEQARTANNGPLALVEYAHALDIAKATGHRKLEGVIWHRVAQTYAAATDDQQAEIHYETAIAIASETDNLYVLGEAQANLAQLYERQGQLKRALPLYREALASLQAVGDRPVEQAVRRRTSAIQVALTPPATVKRSAKPVVAANPIGNALKPSPDQLTRPTHKKAAPVGTAAIKQI